MLRIRIGNTTLKKSNKVVGPTLSDSKAYYNTIIKRVWGWSKSRNTDQYNRKESQEVHS